MNDRTNEPAPPVSTDASTEEDVLEHAMQQLEQAETASDDDRLSALEGIHTRLSDELDAPAGEPLAP